MEASGDAKKSSRVRVGAKRREKMRLRLLVSALPVFNEKGTDLAVIDDFIAAAGVARGTFYNYFKTPNELLMALATAMGDEVVQIIDPLVLHLDNPVERFAAALRLYMQMALLYPRWGRFITQVGTSVATRGQLIDVYLTRDLELAQASGRLKFNSERVARDLAFGASLYGIETMLAEPTLDCHPEQIVRSVLIALGVSAAEAETIAFMPLEIPDVVERPIFSSLKPTKTNRRSGK